MIRRGGSQWFVVLVITSFIWAGGLVWFDRLIPARTPLPTAEADGIVVLTGGARRMDLAVALLAAGHGERVLVSGVYRAATDEEIQRALGHSEDLFQCCIDLGRRARNTRENATEAADWVEARGYRAIHLVTAAYHMPRSLNEFGHAMPHIAIIPHPVYPPDAALDSWWRSPRAITLIVNEYHKYLFSLLRTRVPWLDSMI